jgi:hypothetical protein
MDDTQAHKIISALADGCGPTTGEKVEGSVLQHGDVIPRPTSRRPALEANTRSKSRSSRARAPARMTEQLPVFTRDWCGMGGCNGWS